MRALPLLAIALVTPACALVASHSDAPRPRVRGPIPTRVQQPNKLTFLAFRPRSARTEAEDAHSLRITSEYSSIFENGDVGDERVVLDGELWRTSFALTYGVGPRTDLEVELPIVYASNGFLDRFVESWHDFFGFPGGGRGERERFTYEMEIEKDGRSIYHLEGGEPAIGDVPVVLTHAVVDETSSTPAVAVRVGADLPIGSESKGFGNGALDWGGGVLAEKSWGRWTMTGAVDYVFTRRPSSFVGSGVDVEDDLGAQWGLEYRWNDSLSLLGGLIVNAPVTRDFRIKELDRETISADVGLALDTGPSSTLIVGFEDDVVAESGPDFTFFASWSVGL
ncbi:MAG: DUF3187 family protein [Planctomycetes bacterium]|nr:DUF3187 family protein [Planctomycetota bacterium]